MDDARVVSMKWPDDVRLKYQANRGGRDNIIDVNNHSSALITYGLYVALSHAFFKSYVVLTGS